MPKPTLDLVKGTLDVLILKSLSWGAMHGYAVSRWIREVTDAALTIEEGALYPALHRLEHRGLVESEWAITDSNRQARFYRLTADGRRALRDEMNTWTRFTAAVGLVLSAKDRPAWARTS